MRRVIAGLALATAATLVTVAPAQAAPANPVKTLKQQFKPGHGVRVSETARSYVDGKAAETLRTTGKLAFGKKGVIAADLTSRAKSSGKGNTRTSLSALGSNRTISTGDHRYLQGGIFTDMLPEGKKWLRYPGFSHQSNQMVDIFNPKVLKGLVAKAENVKGDYKGTVTLKQLAAFQDTKIPGKLGKIKVKYLLDTNARGLVTRVVSEWTLDFGLMGSSRTVTDTRYTGWGSKVTIKAPAKSQWLDIADLFAETPDADIPSEIPEDAISSLGVGG
ncbi:hypothetical protein GCM10023096_64150 [Nonomuraea ferruginea]